MRSPVRCQPGSDPAAPLCCISQAVLPSTLFWAQIHQIPSLSNCWSWRGFGKTNHWILLSAIAHNHLITCATKKKIKKIFTFRQILWDAAQFITVLHVNRRPTSWCVDMPSSRFIVAVERSSELRNMLTTNTKPAGCRFLLTREAPKLRDRQVDQDLPLPLRGRQAF